jgi:hypothetical protein
MYIFAERSGGEINITDATVFDHPAIDFFPAVAVEV